VSTDIGVCRSCCTRLFPDIPHRYYCPICQEVTCGEGGYVFPHRRYSIAPGYADRPQCPGGFADPEKDRAP
jgi:hypothetical protein